MFPDVGPTDICPCAIPQGFLWTGGHWVCCCMRCWLGRVRLMSEAMTCQIRAQRTICFKVYCLCPQHANNITLSTLSFSFSLPLSTVILEKTIRIPRNLSVKAAQVRLYDNIYVCTLVHEATCICKCPCKCDTSTCAFS